ncbi:MAG: RNA-directed DNA polymerase [Gammaproteobacteria bacterium]|nr:RNA-directed DNA polymerase [Gammaproteobacteria bacterium]
MTELKINGIQFNRKAIRRYLNQDLRDDWFPDPLQFKDVLDNSRNFYKLFQDYFKAPWKVYSGNPSTQIDIPKPPFTLRYGLELVPQDRIAYQAFATILIESLDEQLPPVVFSHRLTDMRYRRRYLLKNGVDSWTRFEEAMSAELDAGAEWILFTDIANYFESADIDRIDKEIRALIKNLEREQRKVVFKAWLNLRRMLKTWSKYDGLGIPQNRDASSIIGNIFLARLDALMSKQWPGYMRYMDDIRVACDSEAEARIALKVLTRRLRRIGLNVNAKKTFILRAGDEKLNDLAFERDYGLEAISNWMNSGNTRNIFRALLVLQDKLETLIDNQSFGERAFRAVLSRYLRISATEPFRRRADFERFNDQVIDALTDYPSVSDQLIKYLRVAKLSRASKERLVRVFGSEKVRIYSWQRYHLWLLLADIKLRRVTLVREAREILNNVEDIARPGEHAGAVIYLAEMGDDHDRRYIARRFNRFRTLISQRNALIAVSRLRYRPWIQRHVQSHVLKPLVGSYTRLNRRARKEGYLTLPELTSLADFGFEGDFGLGSSP